MGTGDFFKNIITRKKPRKKAENGESIHLQGDSFTKKANGFNWKHKRIHGNWAPSTKGLLGMTIEEIAATRIQTAFPDFMVEWCGGSETMEEILSGIQQREEVAVKRERAMAYAFSHQCKANSSQYLGQTYYELGKESWGWNRKERWIAARPWETRVPFQHITPKKVRAKQGQEVAKFKSQPPKISVSGRPPSSNGYGIATNKKLSSTPDKLPVTAMIEVEKTKEELQAA